jgi:hypothetical protein
MTRTSIQQDLFSVTRYFSRDFPKLRGTTAFWDEKRKTVVVDLYFDGELSEDEHEEAEDLTTQIIGAFNDAFLDSQFIQWDDPKPLPKSPYWAYKRPQEKGERFRLFMERIKTKLDPKKNYWDFRYFLFLFWHRYVLRDTIDWQKRLQEVTLFYVNKFNFPKLLGVTAHWKEEKMIAVLNFYFDGNMNYQENERWDRMVIGIFNRYHHETFEPHGRLWNALKPLPDSPYWVYKR